MAALTITEKATKIFIKNTLFGFQITQDTQYWVFLEFK